MGERPMGAELKRTESYQWPAGHIAHLTEGQLGALERFKKLCSEKGYYTPGTDKEPPTHDDETLLRYLRARKFVPQEAFVQFRDTEDWRKATQLDAIYEGIDINEYDKARRLYPQWTGRRDKRGIPFYVFEVGSVDVKQVTANTNSKNTVGGASTESKTPWRMLVLFALYESLCRFVLPLCSALPGRPHGETPISQSSNIVDLTDVGFSRIWSLRNHMSESSKLATAHYPETLDRIFVVGAPSYFPTIWGWVQRWFDPITVSKIFILGKDNVLSTLEKYVDKENIPKKYGGTLDWKFGDMPYLDPEIANSLRWKIDIRQNGHRSFPIGPIKWQYDEDGDLVAVAIGTENGEKRAKTIAGLHPESGAARLALSPGRYDPKTDIFRNTAARIPPPATAIEQPANPVDKEASAKSAENVGSIEGAVIAGEEAGAEGNDPTKTAEAAANSETFTVPYRNDKEEIASPPDESRKGTSNARLEQQVDTHAEGQMEHGTPALKIDGHGSKQVVMEPRTVGQAPKEHPLPSPEVEQPGVLEQAKNVAGSVLASVGLGGSKEEQSVMDNTPVTPRHDPAVDSMPASNVEEFLRSQTTAAK